MKYVQYIDYLEKRDEEKRWFSIQPLDQAQTRWTGTVHADGLDFTIELFLKDSYPLTPPAARVPELMRYTDRKVDDEILGLRLCDMHMEQNFWWNEYCSLALYMKREVSYWLQSIVSHMQQKGWFEWIRIHGTTV